MNKLSWSTMGSLRDRLLQGDLLVGTMVTINAPAVAELLASVGFDWLFIDAEHSTFSTGELVAMLHGAGREMPCLIRVAAAGEPPVKKALDSGAAGVIVPQVNTGSIAERVVRWAKYAPMGTRGVGITRAHGYGLQFQEYMASANEQTTVVVQAEHIQAVENIEAIVRVPGIDAVLIGPYDLSASLGHPGQVDHPEVLAAIDHVTVVCLAAGIRLGIFGVSAAAVKPYIERGYTLIIAGVDTLLLAGAAGRLLDELRNSSPEG